MRVSAIYSILAVFGLSKGHLLQIRLPKESHELRHVDSETTLCTSIDVAETIYINKLSPILTEDTNHITLVGVGLAGNYEFNKGHEVLSECTNLKANASDSWQSGSNIEGQVIETLYVTGQKGRSLALPPGVAFEVGGSKAIKRLVMQVHFKPMKNWKSSNYEPVGLDVHYRLEEQPLKAGILSLHAGGQILPGARSFLEASCSLDQEIWPLAFLGHTHDLGRTVSLWHVDRGQTKWSLLGTIDAHLPQTFRPVSHESRLHCSQEDILVVRCGYHNDTPNLVLTGSTRKDEMCAAYLLFYVHSKMPNSRPYCMGGQALIP